MGRPQLALLRSKMRRYLPRLTLLLNWVLKSFLIVYLIRESQLTFLQRNKFYKLVNFDLNFMSLNYCLIEITKEIVYLQIDPAPFWIVDSNQYHQRLTSKQWQSCLLFHYIFPMDNIWRATKNPFKNSFEFDY
jgi:hypothetical protein